MGDAELSLGVNQQCISSLFLVPLEIRHRIYEYYLSLTIDDFADTLRPTHNYLDAEQPHATTLPCLMLTCKRAYAELGPYVHTTAALRVHRRGSRNERRIGFAVRGTLRFHRLRYLLLLVHMEHANWNSWLAFFGALLDRIPTLEHLTIDWGPRPVQYTPLSWGARQDEKKECAFLEMLNGKTTLRTVLFYGRVPGNWKTGLRQGIIIKCYPYHWWRESGLDCGL